LIDCCIYSPLLVRQLNDQMMQLERAFIDPAGLPNRPGVRLVSLTEVSDVFFVFSL